MASSSNTLCHLESGDNNTSIKSESGTIRFTVENVSQLTSTASEPVIVADAAFHCLAIHEGNFLLIAVSADESFGELRATVEVALLHQIDPDFDIVGRSENFTFKRDAVLQWPEFARWDQVIENNCFVTRWDSINIEINITFVGENPISAGEQEDRRNRALWSKWRRGGLRTTGGRKSTDVANVTNVSSVRRRAETVPPSVRNTSPETKTRVNRVTQTGSTGVCRLTQTENNVVNQSTQTETGGEIFSLDIVSSVIAKTFECAVCYSFFQPPINLCSRGHSICGSCKPTLAIQQCPSCEADFPENARNYALEGIMEYVLYPCLSVGCLITCTLPDKEKHKLECKKREISCSVSPIGGQSCTWKGALDLFHAHFDEKHVAHLVNLSEHQFANKRFVMKNFETFDKVYHFLCVENNILSLRVSKSEGHFYVCTVMFGTCSEAKQFMCEVRMSSKDPAIDYNFNSSFQVHSDLEKVNGKCVSLSTLECMKENGLIDDRGELTISVCIHRR